jgi:hypothetical protein
VAAITSVLKEIARREDALFIGCRGCDELKRALEEVRRALSL